MDKRTLCFSATAHVSPYLTDIYSQDHIYCHSSTTGYLSSIAVPSQARRRLGAQFRGTLLFFRLIKLSGEKCDRLVFNNIRYLKACSVGVQHTTMTSLGYSQGFIFHDARGLQVASELQLYV